MIACILFGNMCSGKTTVGRLLAHGGDHVVVSAKDAVARNLAAAGDEVKALRAKGYLLPDPVITGWVMGAAEAEIAAGRKVILDGFPRTATQAQGLIDAHGSSAAVIDCACPPAVLLRRFAHRVLCEDCEMPCSRAFEDFDGTCPLCGSTRFAPRPTDRPDYLDVKTRQFDEVSSKVLPVLRGARMRVLPVSDHARFAALRATVSSLHERLGQPHGH
ncbi:MAG: nucleoside monophosphate kinase [Acidobacteriota bacterium]